MITLLEYVNGEAGLKISAYGTSAGVKLEWDERARRDVAEAYATLKMDPELAMSRNTMDHEEAKTILRVHNMPYPQGVHDNFTVPTSSVVYKGEWPDRDKPGYAVRPSKVPTEVVRQAPVDDARAKTPQNW